jgi:predicted component of viral defense system (DUF524 family)
MTRADLSLITLELAGQLRLTIRGPGQHPHLGLLDPDGVMPNGHLSVRVASGPAPALHWSCPDGSIREWTADDPDGPRFYEDTRYRIAAEDLTGASVPRITLRDPSVLGEIDTHNDHHLLTATLNFRRQVGIAELRFTTTVAAVTLTIEVFPTKLDYDSDYHALLQEVSSACRALGLEYLRATYFHGSADDDGGETRLEWVLLLRNEIDRLEHAMRYIAAHPHHALERSVEVLPLERIKRPDPLVRRSVARGLGRGELQNVKGIGPVRPAISTRRSQETLNTPEHRWLRQQLNVVQSQLAQVLSGLSVENEQAKWHGGPRASLPTEQTEVAAFIRRIHLMLQLPPMTEAAGEAPSGAPSLTLLSGLGYREAYRALLTLRLGLNLNTGDVELSVMDLHTLYETWCFLRLAQILSTLAGATGPSSVIETSPSGLRVRLRAGQQSEVSVDHGDRQLVLSYNPNYPGLTGDQRPDIVLEFREEGWPHIIVVFDAKYRLRSDSEYVATSGSPGPPLDGVNALHRYRDAIVVNSEGGPGRPTVKGVALFPLPAAAISTFLGGRLFAALTVLGVGALPFTPTSTDVVANWLSDLLGLRTPELAQPGPPFLAWEQVKSRIQGG